MWSKQAQLTALGAARPLRVAYLIDPAIVRMNCWMRYFARLIADGVDDEH